MKQLITRPNISENVKASNAYQSLGKLLNALESKECNIIKLVEKKHKIVPKNY